MLEGYCDLVYLPNILLTGDGVWKILVTCFASYGCRGHGVGMAKISCRIAQKLRDKWGIMENYIGSLNQGRNVEILPFDTYAQDTFVSYIYLLCDAVIPQHSSALGSMANFLNTTKRTVIKIHTMGFHDYIFILKFIMAISAVQFVNKARNYTWYRWRVG